jgi:hypothetical protein
VPIRCGESGRADPAALHAARQEARFRAARIGYAFDCKMAPAKVRVHMKSASMEEGIWIFIKRL